MITIPTNFSTILKKSEQLEIGYIVRIERSLLASPYTVSHLYLSTVTNNSFYEITDKNSTYPVYQLIESAPKIKERIDYHKHAASVGGFSISMINKNIELNKYNYYNKRIDIYLWIEGITALSDCVLQYKGVIKNNSLKNDIINFTIENRHGEINQQIGTVLSSSDAADGLELPQNSLGKIKPLVYGDSRSYIGNTDTSLINLTVVNYARPARYLGIDSSNKHRWLLGNHAFRSVDEIWMYDSGIGRYVELKDYVVEQNTSAGTIISHDKLEYVYDYWYPDGTVSSVFTQNGGSVTNQTYVANRTLSNSCLFSCADIESEDSPSRQVASLVVDFAGYDNTIDDANIAEVMVMVKSFFNDFSYVGGPVTGSVYQINGEDAKGFSSATMEESGTETADASGVASGVSSVLRGAYSTPAGSTDDNAGRIYAMMKRVKYQPDDLLPVYSASRGREYGSWVDINGRYDQGDEGDLIENPAGVIESLLRDELSIEPELMPNQVDRDFSGASAWTNVDIDDYDESGDLSITSTASGQYCTLPVVSAPTVPGKTYRLQFDVANITNTWNITDYGGTQTIGTVTANGTKQYIEYTAETTGGLRFVSVEPVCAADFDNFSLVEKQIDIDAFDAVAEELSSWSLSFAITKAEESQKLLERIAFETKSLYYVNANNEICIDTFYDTETTDFLINDNNITKFSYEKSELKDVCNNLTLKYKTGYGDNHQAEITRADDRSDTGSQDLYGSHDKIIESDFIADDNTAGLLADHWCKDDDDSFWSVPRDEVEIELAGLRGNYWTAGSFTPAFSAELTDTFEIDDYYLKFNSNESQYVSIGDKAALQTAFDITVEIWFYMTESGSSEILYCNESATNNSGIWILKGAGDKISIRYGDNLGDGSSYRRVRTSDTTLSTDTLYHIVCLFSGTGASFFSNAKIYINGSEESSYTDTGTTTNAVAYAGSGDALIGQRDSTNFTNSKIIQVAHWDTGLSAADVTSLYGDGTPSKDLTDSSSYNADRTGDLQGYWIFDEDSGNTVYDKSGNYFDGTLTNFYSNQWNKKFPYDRFGKRWHGKQFKIYELDRAKNKIKGFSL